MNIAELPRPVLSLTLEYTRATSIQVLRCTCRSFRDVLDDVDPKWESIFNAYCSPRVRLSWAKSPGTTALMVRSSVLRQTCISCHLWFTLKVNKFYDVLLCGRCSKKNLFRVVSLRKACFNYFLDYPSQKDNNRLVKVTHGRSCSVLLMHVRKVALEKYPDGELEKKVNARFARAFKTEVKKQVEKEKRIRAVSYKFCDVLWQTPSRVDAVLRDQGTVMDLIFSFGSKGDVFGDILERRVKASVSTSVVAQHLYDYAAMLTYMRKLNLLDFKYNVTSGHRCTPNNIYRYHVYGGLHFYELTRQHADARDELAGRLVQVETYMLRTSMTESGRTSLAVAMCAEESINYNAEDFAAFVSDLKGNPAEISRRVREREFLNQNHLAWEMNNFLVQGYDNENAFRLATDNVLHRTKGYPPMMRSCFINLTIPPI